MSDTTASLSDRVAELRNEFNQPPAAVDRGDTWELRMQRTKLLDEAHELIDKAQKEDRPLRSHENRKVESLIDQADKMNARIEAIEKRRDRELAEATVIAGDPGPPRIELGEVRMLGPRESIAEGGRRASGQERVRLRQFLRAAVSGETNGMTDFERRQLTESFTGAEGAYLVPSPLSNEIIDLARNMAAVFRAGARTIVMDSQTLRIARVEQDVAATWRSELQTVQETDLVLGAIELRARTLAGKIACSVELLEDAPNAEEIVRNSFARSLALELDRAALRGAGNTTPPADEPLGLFNWPGVEKLSQATNGAALTSFDAISEAVETVRAANFEPSAAIYAPRTAGVIDRLKEATTNAPLGAPQSYVGLQKLVTNQVSVLDAHGSATDASAVYVGDFSQMAIAMRTPLKIEVSRTDAYSWNQLAVSIRAYLRADVVVLQPSAFAIVTGIVPS